MALSTCVVGLQWGDEAKGKVVDVLTHQHDLVVRFNGGANAGHTVKVGSNTYKLSLLPSGIVNPDKTCVIGNGVAINPSALLGEIDQLAQRDLDCQGRLFVSDRSHVILPYHLEQERLSEESDSDQAIGTTRRGIGPCYSDKANRTLSIRMGDMLDPDRFRERLDYIVPIKNRLLTALADGKDAKQFTVDGIIDEYEPLARRIKPLVTDTFWLLQRSLQEEKALLFEAAQGTLLDIDHGSYPFVTSSNSSLCGVSSGCGVSTRKIHQVIGVAKAYTTRVGGGPFPTELTDDIGERIRQEGKEFGTVTGRPRRCGWFDAVAVRYTALLNDINEFSLMLLDVLSKLPEIKICEAYDYNGTRTTEFPVLLDRLADCKPIFRTLPGWQTDISGCRHRDELPAEARAYVDTIAELIDRPVALCSVGPAREETIPWA